MRLPINFLLYTGSVAMLGYAGWLFYQATAGNPPIGNKDDNPSYLGFQAAEQELAAGQGLEPEGPGNIYQNPNWWQQFTGVNLTGKLPEVPVDPVTAPVTTPVDTITPLDEIFELISLMYHNPLEGDDAETHVVLRYKPGAGAQMPEELRPRARGGGSIPGGQTAIANNANRGRGGARGAAPVSSAPLSTVPTMLVHHVEIGESLWVPHDNIKLVRVAEDAQVAYFQRGGTNPEGEEFQPEPMYKGILGLRPELLEKIVGARRAAGDPDATAQAAPQPQTGASGWMDVETTRQVTPGEFMISRNDDQLIREDPQSLLDKVTIRTYRSSTGTRSRNGVQLMNVDPELGRRFGVRNGDVILEVNGVPVQSRAEAIDVGTKQYKRGVRLFKVRMMTMGRIEDRTYRAPDK